MPKKKRPIGRPTKPPLEDRIKSGSISKADGLKIGDLLSKKTPISEIAKVLRRSANQIENYASKYYGFNKPNPKAVEQAEFIRELHNRSEWSFLVKQYSPQELEYYEELYSKLMADFRDDVTTTEDFQIFQAIDLQIFINRHKQSRRKAEMEIMRLEREIQNLTDQKETEEKDDKIQKINNRILDLTTQKDIQVRMSNERTKEFTDLGKKLDAILQQLKGTREQRIKNIENSDKSWVGKIRYLQERQNREREDRNLALRRLATEKAAEKLKQPHRYVNDEWDQPLLVPEDVRIEEGSG